MLINRCSTKNILNQIFGLSATIWTDGGALVPSLPNPGVRKAQASVSVSSPLRGPDDPEKESNPTARVSTELRSHHLESPERFQSLWDLLQPTEPWKLDAGHGSDWSDWRCCGCEPWPCDLLALTLQPPQWVFLYWPQKLLQCPSSPGALGFSWRRWQRLTFALKGY